MYFLHFLTLRRAWRTHVSSLLTLDWLQLKQLNPPVPRNQLRTQSALVCTSRSHLGYEVFIKNQFGSAAFCLLCIVLCFVATICEQFLCAETLFQKGRRNETQAYVPSKFYAKELQVLLSTPCKCEAFASKCINFLSILVRQSEKTSLCSNERLIVPRYV